MRCGKLSRNTMHVPLLIRTDCPDKPGNDKIDRFLIMRYRYQTRDGQIATPHSAARNDKTRAS